MKWIVIGAFVWIGAVALPTDAEAALKTYMFENITHNNAQDEATGENQLSVTVFSSGEFGLTLDPNQVGFRFQNAGPYASSITDVYFDDGTLLGIASIHEAPGVAFSQGASPGNLPGGNAIDFVTTAGFLSDSDPPVKPNGVQPGEYLMIVFNLIDGQDYDDTIAALALGRQLPEGQTGSLRIGIHVQGFAGGGSESFVNSPPALPSVVPEPATIIVWTGLGLAGFAASWRRRRLL